MRIFNIVSVQIICQVAFLQNFLLTAANGFEPGYYPNGMTGSAERKKIEEINGVWTTMNQTLVCFSEEKFLRMVRACSIGEKGPGWQAVKKDGKTMYFTKEEIRALLIAEPEKGLLVVDYRGYPGAKSVGALTTKAATLLPFLKPLGFKRLIILSPYAKGRVICFDSQK